MRSQSTLYYMKQNKMQEQVKCLLKLVKYKYLCHISLQYIPVHITYTRLISHSEAHNWCELNLAVIRNMTPS